MSKLLVVLFLFSKGFLCLPMKVFVTILEIKSCLKYLHVLANVQEFSDLYSF